MRTFLQLYLKYINLNKKINITYFDISHIYTYVVLYTTYIYDTCN